MRLSAVLTPFSDENLQLAEQCGVSDVVVRRPGRDLADFLAVKERAAKFGLRVSVIEGGLPIERIKVGHLDADADIEETKELIHNMAAAEIPICCYNFMAGTDWVRTKLDEKERGGALVTHFDMDDVDEALSLTDVAEKVGVDPISAEELWANLQRYLRAVVPVAESCGVILAMHPDDPPLDEFLGRARIMNNVENFERLVSIVPSPSNAICFCQGSFATMGVDIPATIRRLVRHPVLILG